jgi:hypothetical protein
VKYWKGELVYYQFGTNQLQIVKDDGCWEGEVPSSADIRHLASIQHMNHHMIAELVWKAVIDRMIDALTVQAECISDPNTVEILKLAASQVLSLRIPTDTIMTELKDILSTEAEAVKKLL